MIPYAGCWMDCFQVSVYTGEERPHCKGKILLETPSGDFFMTREQWMEFKKKVNDFEG